MKKKLKEPSKLQSGGDGGDRDPRTDGASAGTGQDNDEMDAYHEPVCLHFILVLMVVER